jgi:hypothetical protein
LKSTWADNPFYFYVGCQSTGLFILVPQIRTYTPPLQPQIHAAASTCTCVTRACGDQLEGSTSPPAGNLVREMWNEVVAREAGRGGAKAFFGENRREMCFGSSLQGPYM